MSLGETSGAQESLPLKGRIVEKISPSELVTASAKKIGELTDSETLEKLSRPIGKVTESVALAAIPGGQAVVAGQIIKEMAKTAAKEGAKCAVREVAAKAAEESDSKFVGYAIREAPELVSKLSVDGGAGRQSDVVETDDTDKSGDEVADSTAECGETIEKNGGTGEAQEATEETENTGEDVKESDLVEQILAADGDLGRLDDNGLLIKDGDGNLLPKIEYEVNGNTYATDENGRIVNWEAVLRDTPENERDEGAQREVGGGGENHGGHLVARMNGGAPGAENMVSMRGTINSGDYLRVEKVENQLVKEGHDVHEEGRVEYEGDSKTPSKIEKHVFVDGVERIDQKLDNVKGSTELLNDLEGVLSEEQMSQLRDVVSDMKADGCEVSVTSYTKEYDAEGNLTAVRVDYRNESAEPKPKRDHMTFDINHEN